MINEKRFNAAEQMGCLENPECQASFLRVRVSGLACFGPSVSQSATSQTENQNQVGVEGGSGGQTAAVGAGTTGGVAENGGININDSGAHSGAETINVTTQDAANDALAFSTIDHLITAESSANAGTVQSASDTAGASSGVGSQAPVIITTGSNGGPVTSGGGSTQWANYAIIAGAVIGLIAFLRSKGKSTG